MKVAVITPYYKEPIDMLRRAHHSVMSQTHACTHYMIADGHARPEIDDWNVRHIVLPVAHDNNGNTPRAIGSLDAIGDDFDAIAYLDADNWFEPNHIEILITAHKETDAEIVTSGRVIHGIEGEVLLPDGETGDGERHADTSAILLTAAAFSVIPVWSLMPKEMGPNCDRMFFQSAGKMGLRHAHSPEPTMHFTSRYGPHYRAAGLPVPLAATAMSGMKKSEDFIRELTFLGCSDFLNTAAIKKTLMKRVSHPAVIIVLAKEDNLGSEFSAMIDALEASLTGAEFYFSDPDELVTETDVTSRNSSVFVVVFEDYTEDSDVIERIIDARPDLKYVWVRSPALKPGAAVDTFIDRRAWRVVVDCKPLYDHYHQQNKYGAGHLILAENLQDFAIGLSKAMTRHKDNTRTRRI